MIPNLQQSQTLFAVPTSSSKDGGGFPKATAICLQTLPAKRGKTWHIVPVIPSHPTQRMQQTSCFSATEVPHIQTQPLHVPHIFMSKLPNVNRFQQFCLWGQDPPNTRRAHSRWTIPGSVLWRDASHILQFIEKNNSVFHRKKLGETARSVTEEESRRHILKFE